MYLFLFVGFLYFIGKEILGKERGSSSKLHRVDFEMKSFDWRQL